VWALKKPQNTTQRPISTAFRRPRTTPSKPPPPDAVPTSISSYIRHLPTSALRPLGSSARLCAPPASASRPPRLPAHPSAAPYPERGIGGALAVSDAYSALVRRGGGGREREAPAVSIEGNNGGVTEIGNKERFRARRCGGGGGGAAAWALSLALTPVGARRDGGRTSKTVEKLREADVVEMGIREGRLNAFETRDYFYKR